MKNNPTDKEAIVYVPINKDDKDPTAWEGYIRVIIDGKNQWFKPILLSVLVWDEVRKMAYSTGEIDWTELRNFMLNDKPTK